MTIEQLNRINLIEIDRPYHTEGLLYPDGPALFIDNKAALIAKTRFDQSWRMNLHVYADRLIHIVSQRIALGGNIEDSHKPLTPGIGDKKFTLLDHDERVIYIGKLYEVGFRRSGEGMSVRIESTQPFERLVGVPRYRIITALKAGRNL